MTVAPAPPLTVGHPAKFSQEILDALDVIIPLGVRVLDPMAGVGYIHRLEGRDTLGIDIEPEWAGAHPRNRLGNALALPWKDGTLPWVVTSPSYGNRMADHHDAKEKCKTCGGLGVVVVEAASDMSADALQAGALTEGRRCPKCGGVGTREYKRLTYRHTLGRPLHPDNSGQLAWGSKYRRFHERAWGEVHRVLEPGGRFVLNVKNHHRTIGTGDDRRQEVMHVWEWHRDHLISIGFRLVTTLLVEVRGMGFGQNRDAREPYEYLGVFEKTV